MLDTPGQTRGAPIPDVFCWTKMGAEAGQTLSSILERKELERLAGGGSFSWGIGSSLGTAAEEARQVARGGQLDILFTPMKSPAKPVDSMAEDLVIWTTCELRGGTKAMLPEHMVLTSRRYSPTGKLKNSHYALLCISKHPINTGGNVGTMDASYVRNFASNNPVGASQVTAVVSYGNPKLPAKSDKTYPIAFRAQFYGLGFIKLVDPIPLTGKLNSIFRDLRNATDANTWKQLSIQLRNAAEKNNRKTELQHSLFDNVSAF